MPRSRARVYSPRMTAFKRLAVFALMLAMLTPAAADDALRCLSRNEQRAAIADGRALPLATARRVLRQKLPGELVKARLCRQPERLIYLLTVLARDGKVALVTVDAANGTVLGGL
jgi:uncharacterized membrane protein YkoI